MGARSLSKVAVWAAATLLAGSYLGLSARTQVLTGLYSADLAPIYPRGGVKAPSLPVDDGAYTMSTYAARYYGAGEPGLRSGYETSYPPADATTYYDAGYRYAVDLERSPSRRAPLPETSYACLDCDSAPPSLKSPPPLSHDEKRAVREPEEASVPMALPGDERAAPELAASISADAGPAGQSGGVATATHPR